MEIKLLALDLDDTTLNERSELSPGNRAALLEAHRQGIEIVIASGRAYDTLPREMLSFPGVRNAITSNGAGVYRVDTGEVILHRTLPEGAVEQILRLTEGLHLTFEAFVDGKAYCDRRFHENPFEFVENASGAAYVRATRRPVEDIVAFIREHRKELDSLDLVVDGPETKREMEQRLKTVDSVYITSSESRLIGLSHRDCGKHRALAFLCEYLGIPRETVVAFGNGDNDADMLSWAGLGVAVANASPGCLAAGDLVAENYLEDGVGKTLKRLFAENKS